MYEAIITFYINENTTYLNSKIISYHNKPRSLTITIDLIKL